MGPGTGREPGRNEDGPGEWGPLRGGGVPTTNDSDVLEGRDKDRPEGGSGDGSVGCPLEEEEGHLVPQRPLGSRTPTEVGGRREVLTVTVLVVEVVPGRTSPSRFELKSKLTCTKCCSYNLL